MESQLTGFNYLQLPFETLLRKKWAMTPLIVVIFVAALILAVWGVTRIRARYNRKRLRAGKPVRKLATDSYPSFLISAAVQSPPNIPSDWKSAGAWRFWAAPLNIVTVEPDQQEALLKIAGSPRPQGYLVPVAVTLRRKRSISRGSFALPVEVEGKQVGYIDGEVSNEIFQALERFGCFFCTVAGLLRGGSTQNPCFGVYLWVDKRISKGPVISVKDEGRRQVPWPPTDAEGK